LVTSLSELPQVGGTGLVIAYDWLWRLPVDLFQYDAAGGTWSEVRLVATSEGELTELLVPTDASRVGGLIPGSPVEGARYAALVGAAEWLADALRTTESGFLAVVDYWTPATEPSPGARPVLAVDQLSRARKPLHPEPQALSWANQQLVTWRLG
jgi:hypothetical protein